MGRIQELRQKVEQGTATDEEKSELEELVSEAKDVSTDEPSDTPDVPEGDDPEVEVDKLADRFVDKVAPVTEKLDSVLKAISKHDTPEAEVTKEVKYFVDPQYGKKSIEELEDIKIEIPGRKEKGKKYYEVSRKSALMVTAIMTGDVEKLQPLLEGAGARGGFLVPDDYANVLIEDIRDQTVMRQVATVMNTTSDTLHVPSLASRPRAAWRAEGAVKSTSTVDFAENILTPYSVASIVPMSQELVDDARLGVNGSIVGKVGELLSQSIAEVEDKAYWTGSGSGQPTGLNSYTFRTVAAGAGASDSARADALRTALWTLPQGFRNRAAFVANGATWSRLLNAKDTTGNYLFTGMLDATTRTILGRPVYEQNDLEAGVAFVGDFSAYVIADRDGIRVDQSNEATVGGQNAFERNLVHVRAEHRTDGELTMTRGIVEVTGLGNP